MDPSQEVHAAAQQLCAATESTVAEALNGFIGKFVGWPFSAAPGFVVDADGNRTETFASVSYTTSRNVGGPHAEGFPADGVAAVIDAGENLDLDSLRAAYHRIAQAKRLKKKRAPDLKGALTTTVTLGIILALRSALPLETLAEELDRLNVATPARERTDMLVVASTGVINYAVQMPSEGVSGDFLPPGEGAIDAFTPPMYIVMVMRPSGAYTLNKMMAFLIAHLEIFSPGVMAPRWIEILKGVTQHVVTLSGYQYNQRGELLPVPRQFYNDRYIAPRPMRIEDQQGNLLSTLQFLPWQDGAAILLKGKLPLEGLLVFLGKDALKRGGTMKLTEGQISYVLPITEADFGQMLTRIQRQSNMVVRPEETSWVVQRIADEGSQSPYIARLMIGMFRLRDAAFPDPSTRDGFDKSYDFVMTSLSVREPPCGNLRASGRSMPTRWLLVRSRTFRGILFVSMKASTRNSDNRPTRSSMQPHARSRRVCRTSPPS